MALSRQDEQGGASLKEKIESGFFENKEEMELTDLYM